MNEKEFALRNTIMSVVHEAIQSCLPDAAVRREMVNLPSQKGKRILIAVGKAAYQMAKAAIDTGVSFDDGIVITKYHHVEGKLPGIRCFEAGHPILDENTIRATKEAIDLVKPLNKDDLVVFLVSGGGSALFELPLVPLEELKEITNQLLGCGADIVEINTIRKRLSDVKGGRFARHCAPAKVYNILLSDVLGDNPDMIASGPTVPDVSTVAEVEEILAKYPLRLSSEAKALCRQEAVSTLDNITTVISGSVSELCHAAEKSLQERGFQTQILSTFLSCEAREAGAFIASMAQTFQHTKKPLAFLFGGETVVHLQGKGKGGRNQELVFGAARLIEGLDNVCVFSVGSDGTDGPTDAAGGYVTGETMNKLRANGFVYRDVLKENDTYTALSKINQLIKTGSTGTNVNDLSGVLIYPKQ